MEAKAQPHSGINPVRTMLYVDGFNFYFGMKENNNQRFFWLDVHALGKALLREGEVLVAAKYFTSRVSKPSDKVHRQSNYIDAIKTTPAIVIEGKFQAKPVACKKCGHSWQAADEKMTDVNIATEMLVDAFGNQFDKTILVSGDADLVPPIRAIRAAFPDKAIVVAFPPRRSTAELKSVANGFLFVNHQHLAKCQFPDEVKKANGHILHRPENWK